MNGSSYHRMRPTEAVNGVLGVRLAMKHTYLPMSLGLWPRGTRGLLEGSSIQTLREEQRKLSQNESEDGGMAGKEGDIKPTQFRLPKMDSLNN
jgi:hypothetical protein